LADEQDALLLIHRHHHGRTGVAHYGSFDTKAGLGVDRDVMRHTEQSTAVDFFDSMIFMVWF
jgi:hypothetical protein